MCGGFRPELQPVEVVAFDEVPKHLPHCESNRVTPEEYTARIAARQVGIARRMIS